MISLQGTSATFRTECWYIWNVFYWYEYDITQYAPSLVFDNHVDVYMYRSISIPGSERTISDDRPRQRQRLYTMDTVSGHTTGSGPNWFGSSYTIAVILMLQTVVVVLERDEVDPSLTTLGFHTTNDAFVIHRASMDHYPHHDRKTMQGQQRKDSKWPPRPQRASTIHDSFLHYHMPPWSQDLSVHDDPDDHAHHSPRRRHHHFVRIYRSFDPSRAEDDARAVAISNRVSRKGPMRSSIANRPETPARTAFFHAWERAPPALQSESSFVYQHMCRHGSWERRGCDEMTHDMVHVNENENDDHLRHPWGSAEARLHCHTRFAPEWTRASPMEQYLYRSFDGAYGQGSKRR